MLFEFVGESARDDASPKVAPSRLINCYSEVSDGNRTIRPVMGVAKTLPTDAAVPKAAERVGDAIYAVIGTELHEVTTTTAVPLADFGDVTTATSISGNNGKVTIVTNEKYHVWDGETLTQINPGAFAIVTDVTFFAQRTIVLERRGRRIQWSALLDPTTFDPLDFATTETRDDNVMRALPLGGQLWIFKETSLEQWAPGTDGPEYIPGSTMDIGLLQRNLVTARPNGLVWVTNDGKVRDSSLGILSTPAVQSAIANGVPVGLSYYEDEGNEIVCLIFSDRPAWCCNLSTGEWHERASGDDLGPWDARRVVMGWGTPFAFAQSGGVDQLGRAQTDRTPLHRRIVSRTLDMEGARFRVSKLDLTFNTGEGGAFLFRVSGDRGRTWGDWRERSLGEVGEYGRHVSLRNLGQFRTFNIELAMADAVATRVWAQASLEVA